MPEMNGFEATQHLREFEMAMNLPRVRIIACTAHAMPEHIQHCREAGMDDHLAKPIGLAQLQEYLNSLSVSGAALN